jgi:hypothetical protein
MSSVEATAIRFEAAARGAYDAYFRLAGVDALAAELRAREAPISSRAPWSEATSSASSWSVAAPASLSSRGLATWMMTTGTRCTARGPRAWRQGAAHRRRSATPWESSPPHRPAFPRCPR